MRPLSATSASNVRFIEGFKTTLTYGRHNRVFVIFRPSSVSRKFRSSIQCSVRFRPCIDIHKGKVKQIVGSTLQDLKGDGSNPVTNFESDKSPAEYANLYKEDGLSDGHVIMLGADPLSKAAALEALHAFPGVSNTSPPLPGKQFPDMEDDSSSHMATLIVLVAKIHSKFGI